MAKKPIGLKIDVEASIAELARAPQITQGGTIRLGDMIVSATGVTSQRQTRNISAECLSLSDAGNLGRGSSGCVRRVRNIQTGEQLALKEIKLTSEHHLDEIRRELLTLHTDEVEPSPYLVEFHGAYSQEGSVFIAMECMDGSLADMQMVPIEILGKMAADMLQGLYYLHKLRHLVHRDIKPSNMLYNKTGRVKISDFGVCSQLESTVANAHSFVGTVTYMSPERLRGEPYSTPADIWGLGITLAELALGTHPYSHLMEDCLKQGTEARFWVLVQHLGTSAPALSLPADMDPHFADFVMRCVEKDPHQRPTAAELLEHPFIRKTSAGSEAANHTAVLQWLSSVDRRVKVQPGSPAGAASAANAGAQRAMNSQGLEAALGLLVDLGN